MGSWWKIHVWLQSFKSMVGHNKVEHNIVAYCDQNITFVFLFCFKRAGSVVLLWTVASVAMPPPLIFIVPCKKCRELPYYHISLLIFQFSISSLICRSYPRSQMRSFPWTDISFLKTDISDLELTVQYAKLPERRIISERHFISKILFQRLSQY